MLLSHKDNFGMTSDLLGRHAYVACRNDGELHVWRAGKAKADLLRRLNTVNDRAIERVCALTNGRLVTASYSGRCQVWNALDGSLDAEFDLDTDLDSVASCAASDDFLACLQSGRVLLCGLRGPVRDLGLTSVSEVISGGLSPWCVMQRGDSVEAFSAHSEHRLPLFPLERRVGALLDACVNDRWRVASVLEWGGRCTIVASDTVTRKSTVLEGGPAITAFQRCCIAGESSTLYAWGSTGPSKENVLGGNLVAMDMATGESKVAFQASWQHATPIDLGTAWVFADGTIFSVAG